MGTVLNMYLYYGNYFLGKDMSSIFIKEHGNYNDFYILYQNMFHTRKSTDLKYKFQYFLFIVCARYQS